MTGNRALKNLSRDLAAKLRDVEYLACYSAAMAQLIRQRYRWAKWLIAIAACVPFLARVRAVAGPVADWFIATVPLLALSLPIWNPEKTIEEASTLHGRFIQILPQLRALWRRLRDFEGPSEATGPFVNEVADKLELLEQELASFRPSVSNLPSNRKLKIRCKSSIPEYRYLETEPPRGPNDVAYKVGN